MTPVPLRWTRVEPGIYHDEEGGVHLVVPELIAASGYADTVRNRETVVAVARQVFARAGLTVNISHEETIQ